MNRATGLQTVKAQSSSEIGVSVLLQRKCACGSSAGLSGDCEECSKKKSGVQRKFMIGDSNDPLEQEADRVADQVMAAPAHQAVHAAPSRLQPYSGSDNERHQTVSSASVDEVIANSGRPLEPVLRRDMDLRFGHDFSQVRVHTGAAAERSAREMAALAYTFGKDIVFGHGRFAPETNEGQRLLAHELTHVVQQSQPSHRALTSTAPPMLMRQEDPTERPIARETPNPGPEPAPGETSPLPADDKPKVGARTDAFGKECPDSVTLQDTKAIPAYNKKMFDAGFRTYFGLVSNMKVGPKSSYETCITEVLKVEENTCGDQGNMADYAPCTPKKHCMKVGEACGGDVLTETKFPCSTTTFVDLHRTDRPASLLEGSGKTECKVKCLQRYGCGGKEIGRFHVTRNFKAAEFTDGKNKVPVTTGNIEKEVATK